jgi:antitoxin VapB
MSKHIERVYEQGREQGREQGTGAVLRPAACRAASVTEFREIAVATTKLFKNGNSQAVRIPAELAYPRWDIDLVIEREGDELRIRPAQRRMGDVLAKWARFAPDFMAEGRGENVAGERESL